MGDESEDVPQRLDRLCRDVLRLAAVPRSAGDMRFLRGEVEDTAGAVERCLQELEQSELVQRSSQGLWTQTAAGQRLLREIDDWELAVDDVFNITARPRPVLVGTIRRGVVYAGDWFLVNGQELGRIVGVEIVCGPNVRADSVSFTADIDLQPGDVLTRHEPMAA